MNQRAQPRTSLQRKAATLRPSPLTLIARANGKVQYTYTVSKLCLVYTQYIIIKPYCIHARPLPPATSHMHLFTRVQYLQQSMQRHWQR